VSLVIVVADGANGSSGANWSVSTTILVCAAVTAVSTSIAILALMLLNPRRRDDVRKPRRRAVHAS